MPSVNIIPSGGLLTHQFIEAIEQPSFNHSAAHPETFTLPARKPPSGGELENTIGSAWELLVERWDSIEQEIHTFDISTLRTRWLRPLMDLLDFSLEYQRADLIIDDLRFPISHMALPANAGDCPVPFLSVLPDGPETLDTRTNSGSGIKRLAPHDVLQRYLNMTHEHRWGLVTDGLRLRLLRDYHHTYTRGFVEFDLEGIFTGRDFAAFRALFRLCHASRFVPIESDQPEDDAEEPEEAPEAKTPLDKFYEDALATGIEVGDKLRQSVLKAIEAFGNGFLQATPGLLSRFQQQELDVDDFYDDVLHVIYRILFILFAEQRGMLPGRGSLYMDTYSLTALRRIAERPIGEDRHLDLWEQLKTSFSMLEHGVPALDIFGYNGALFASRKTPILTPPESNNSQPPRLRNDALLTAIRDLTTIEEEGVRQRISYIDLSVEEMGSVYESLLDFTPRIAKAAEVVDGREIPAGAFFLDPKGQKRRETGSYYTRPSLVNELIQSALVPVLEERLAEAAPGYDLDHPEALSDQQKTAAEKALLDLKVLDPASGSGAFLIAANNTLGLRLAQIRAGDLYPPEKITRSARRDVLAHCIYGVDLNPMAVELCKVSLWINAAVEDKKLNFLDHHIKPGNSLVGIGPNLPVNLENEVLLDFSELEIPDGAYDPLSMDGKTIARAARDRNKAEIKLRKQNARQPVLWQVTSVFHSPEQSYSEITELGLSDPAEAEKRYQNWAEAELYQLSQFAADLWTAAFFWHYDEETANRLEPPTEARFRLACEEGPRAFELAFVEEVNSLNHQYGFFHWQLEFPEVFNSTDTGFDVVLGNPPWDQIQLMEKEFFLGKDSKIANSSTGAKRRKLIKKLPLTNPQLWEEYQLSLHAYETISKFLRTSQRFPLTSKGRINTYQVFSGLTRHIISAKGRGGIIVQTGIATDYYNQDFFNSLIQNNELVSLFDFKNVKKLFNIAPIIRFCLMTISGKSATSEKMEFAYFLSDTNELRDPDRIFSLSTIEIERINPNTGTSPVFKNRQEASISAKIYDNSEVIINQKKHKNPWGIEFKQGLFNMTSDSSKFRSKEELEKEGFLLNGNIFYSNSETWYPLYEAKMIVQYNHRHGTFQGVPKESLFKTKAPTNSPSLENLTNADFVVLPRYWVNSTDINNAKNNNWIRNWNIVFRNVIQLMTNARSAIFSILPYVGIGNSAPILYNDSSTLDSILIIANANTFIFDFITRRKMGGNNLNFYIVEQLPVITQKKIDEKINNFIIPKVLELIYTSWDLINFINDTWANIDAKEIKRLIQYQWQNNSQATNGGHAGTKPPEWVKYYQPDPPDDPFPYPPFMWDEERRAQLRADLDGLYGHLYGLHRDELAYILDTFPIVQRRDEEQFGEYRTKRLVLEAYDRLTGSDLIPEEARLQSQISVLDAPSTNPEPNIPPATKPQPKQPQPVSSEEDPVEESADEPEHKTDPAPADEAASSDYGLYKCQGCGKIVVGFDKPTHTRQKHASQDPGYQKMS